MNSGVGDFSDEGADAPRAEEGRRPGGAEDGRWKMGYRIWDMGTKPLGSGAEDPAAAGPRKGRHRLPGGQVPSNGI